MYTIWTPGADYLTQTGLTLKALSKIIADDIILVFLLLFFQSN